MEEANYWSAFLLLGGPGLGLFIWYLIGFIIDEKKKAAR